MMFKRFFFIFFFLMLMLVVLLVIVQDDGFEFGWYDIVEFIYVIISGNVEVDMLGFKNLLQCIWDNVVFFFDVGVLCVEMMMIVCFVCFLGDGVNVGEVKIFEFIVENYYLCGCYDCNIIDCFFWYVGVGWECNEFVGFIDCLIVVVGVGNIWW